ncbi:MAG TPA: formate dehydrogenase accessory protein FdhE [bacterium]|nr:formate dehydrogenase accessory protein FdhE [bacterium]
MDKSLQNLQQFSNFYIDFHEKIFNTHVKCMQHLFAAIPFQKFNKIDIAEKIKHRQPILNPQQLIIEEKDLEQLFDFVYPVVKQYLHLRKKEVSRLGELNDKRKFSLKELLIALINKDTQTFDNFSKKLAVPSLLLEMITELISAPYFELVAEFFSKKLSKFQWCEPFCPICGGIPSMAQINEQTGLKILWCRRCNNPWTFTDKICPHCMNSEIKSQSFIFLTNFKPYRIEACNKCNNYLKTIDNLIQFNQVNFSVVNIATYYLDLLAKNYGYQLNNYVRFYFDQQQFS